MKNKELVEKIALLKAGQIVQIDGNFFRARFISRQDVQPCDVCQLDSICHGSVSYVCEAMDSLGKRRWYLELANINNNKQYKLCSK